MSFPNSIILAANYSQIEGEVVEDEEVTWKLEQINESLFQITIPTKKKLAAIIDGQHRLRAFEYIEDKKRLDLEIPCSIFFDLPNSYQAFLFATINGNQKKVDRSLALEQFGFNVEDEPQKSWTPEKLAVFFSRKLNLSKEKTPFYHRIKVAPRIQATIIKDGIESKDWHISTSTVVDGIVALISSNPKRDRVDMAMEQIFVGRTRSMVKDNKDNSPLRSLYLHNQDEEIYDIVVSFFEQINNLFWANAKPKSYIVKTVGILALFDLLKKVLEQNPNEKSFEKYLVPFQNADFSNNYFQASGVGRSRLRKLMFWANDFSVTLKEDEEEILRKILNFQKPS